MDDFNQGKRDFEVGIVRRKPGAGYEAGYQHAESLQKGRNAERPEDKVLRERSSFILLCVVGAVACVIALLSLASMSSQWIDLLLGPGFTWLEQASRSQPWILDYYSVAVGVPIQGGIWLSDRVQALVPVPPDGTSSVPELFGAIAVIFCAALIAWIIYRIFWRIRRLRWVGVVVALGPLAIAAILRVFN